MYWNCTFSRGIDFLTCTATLLTVLNLGKAAEHVTSPTRGRLCLLLRSSTDASRRSISARGKSASTIARSVFYSAHAAASASSGVKYGQNVNVPKVTGPSTSFLKDTILPSLSL